MTVGQWRPGEMGKTYPMHWDPPSRGQGVGGEEVEHFVEGILFADVRFSKSVSEGRVSWMCVAVGMGVCVVDSVDIAKHQVFKV